MGAAHHSFPRVISMERGGGMRKKKVATNCSTDGATASQRRSNVYRRYVKKKRGKREIYETVTPLIIFRPSVHEDRDNPS